MQDLSLLLRFITAHYSFLILLGFITYIIGYRLTRRISYHSVWEEISVCIALGLGAVAFIVFGLSLVGLLYRWVTLLAIAVCLAACYRVLPQLLRRLLPALQRIWLSTKLVIVALGLVLSIPILKLPLYPPTVFDATMYFLTSAKIYARSHQLIVTPYLRFQVLPQINEMLFTLALLFYDDIAAHLIQLLMLMTLAIAVFAFGLRYFSKRAGWWAVAILLANPLVLWSGSVAYLDICLMLFATMAIYTFWNWLYSREGHWLILAGVFCGFAAGTKYPGIFFLGILGLVTLYVAIRERKYAPPFVLAGMAVAVSAPWYLRNFYYTGNPVFPFFPKLFGYSWWSAEDLQGVLDDLQRAHGIGRSLSALLLLPWHLAFNQGVFIMEAPLSPIYFFLLPLIAVFSVKNARIRSLLSLALTFTLFWFFSAQILRFILPALPIMSIAAAASLDHLLLWLPFTRRWTNHAVTIAIGFVLLIYTGWLYAAYRSFVDGSVPVTQKQRDTYLAQRLPSYPAYKMLNGLKGGNYTLYAMQDENMAYFVDGLYMGDYFGPARYTRVWSKFTNGQALYDELKGMGADYFLVNSQRMKINLPQDEFFKRHFKPIYTKGNVLLFELDEKTSQIEEASKLPQDQNRQELLQNPGFEELEGDEPKLWQRNGNPAVDASGKNSHSGLVAVRIKGADNVFTQVVPVKSGGSYLLSFQARALEPGQSARMQVNWSNSQGQFLGTNIEVVQVGPNWERYEMSVTVPETAANAVIYASCHEQSSVWFDDFSFIEAN